MADVFISYARPDEGQADRVADALRQEGYRVWRDDELPAHRAYAEVIEERLKSANAVVVLWSLVETDYHSWAMLVTCYQAGGNREGVMRGAQMMISQSERVLAEDPSNGAALGISAGGHAILGHRDQAMETIDRALLIDPDNLNMRYNFACVLAGYLFEVEPALDLLETVLTQANLTLVNTTITDSDLDPLRGNPRFEQMLAGAMKRLGIKPTAATAAS